jgi:hypothetical protein
VTPGTTQIPTACRVLTAVLLASRCQAIDHRTGLRRHRRATNSGHTRRRTQLGQVRNHGARLHIVALEWGRPYTIANMLTLADPLPSALAARREQLAFKDIPVGLADISNARGRAGRDV